MSHVGLSTLSLESLVAEGKQCGAVLALFASLIPPEATVIEVGANIGMHSIPLSRIAHQGKVVCLEPQRVVFQLLSGNCALNNRTNSYAERMAVGARTGMTTIVSTDYETPWNYGACSLRNGFDAEGVFSGVQWKVRRLSSRGIVLRFMSRTTTRSTVTS